MELQKDDKITIRNWSDMKAEFGVGSSGSIPCEATFAAEMKHLCGKHLQ